MGVNPETKQVSLILMSFFTGKLGHWAQQNTVRYGTLKLARYCGRRKYYRTVLQIANTVRNYTKRVIPPDSCRRVEGTFVINGVEGT